LLGIELGMFLTRTDNKHGPIYGEKRLSQMEPEERRVSLADLLARAREAIDRQRAVEAQAQEAEEGSG
jgi:hypothetical protein